LTSTRLPHHGHIEAAPQGSCRVGPPCGVLGVPGFSFKATISGT